MGLVADGVLALASLQERRHVRRGEVRGREEIRTMQLTLDSDEPLERVLEVVGALYGVQVQVAGPKEPTDLDDSGDQGIVKVRH